MIGVYVVDNKKSGSEGNKGNVFLAVHDSCYFSKTF